MRRKIKNEDSIPLDQTQPTSANSSWHKGIHVKRVLSSFYCKIYIPSKIKFKKKKKKNF